MTSAGSASVAATSELVCRWPACARRGAGHAAVPHGRCGTGACGSPHAPRGAGTHAAADSRSGDGPAPVP